MTYGLDFIASWRSYSHASFSLCEHTVLHVIMLKKKKKEKEVIKWPRKGGSGEM
jgi:hypothetical protein